MNDNNIGQRPISQPPSLQTRARAARAIVESLDTMKTHYYNCCEMQVEDCTDYRLEEKGRSNEDSTEKDMYKLYPNPSANELTFEYKLFETEQINVSLYDLSGKILVSESFNSNVGIQKINTSNLSGGIYLFTVAKGSKTKYRQKVCIIK